MKNIFILSLIVLLSCRESESLNIEFEANASINDIPDDIKSTVLAEDFCVAFFQEMIVIMDGINY